MSAEHDRLLAAVAPLRAIGWVFVPTTLAAPTPTRTVDALFGLHSHNNLEDTLQTWEQWAIASRIRKSPTHETPLWHTSGPLNQIIQELLNLP